MDFDIIRLLRANDQEAIALIEERYGRLIHYIAETVLGHRISDIEECVNDVYMKLWTHGAGYDYRKAAFKTYLKTIVRNTALNYLRKISRQENYEQPDEDSGLQEAYIDYSQDVEQEMIRREEIDALERVVKKLKEKDRELVLRRFYYMQTTKQIAAAMKMSEASVDTKLSRLRKKMKKQYERGMAGE